MAIIFFPCTDFGNLKQTKAGLALTQPSTVGYTLCQCSISGQIILG